MISTGQLRPGDALAYVRELATKHAENPMTISKAYSLLEAEGLRMKKQVTVRAFISAPSPGRRQLP
jgi:GntR family transcriptional regulator